MRDKKKLNVMGHPKSYTYKVGGILVGEVSTKTVVEPSWRFNMSWRPVSRFPRLATHRLELETSK